MDTIREKGTENSDRERQKEIKRARKRYIERERDRQKEIRRGRKR